MNIQQLNQSGQSIWTFLITAFVILFLTGIWWMCVKVFNDYRSWSRKAKPSPFILRPRPNYTIMMRVWMLIWLIYHKHWTWARKTKAWREILANGRPNPEVGFQSNMTYLPHVEDENLSAGDYVSKYMFRRDQSLAFTFDDSKKKRKEMAAKNSPGRGISMQSIYEAAS